MALRPAITVADFRLAVLSVSNSTFELNRAFSGGALHGACVPRTDRPARARLVPVCACCRLSSQLSRCHPAGINLTTDIDGSLFVANEAAVRGGLSPSDLFQDHHLITSERSRPVCASTAEQAAPLCGPLRPQAVAGAVYTEAGTRTSGCSIRASRFVDNTAGSRGGAYVFWCQGVEQPTDTRRGSKQTRRLLVLIYAVPPLSAHCCAQGRLLCADHRLVSKTASWCVGE